MRSPPPQDDALPADDARAEAAVWIARLHDERRNPSLDAHVQTWLAQTPEHRQAFERMSRVWERTAGLRLRAPDGSAPTRNKRARPSGWALPVVACVLLGSAVAIFRLSRENRVVTEIGQQQVRLLPDGTRVMLNTDTRVEVLYDRNTRRVRLLHGEAWFDVSKRPAWPFVVIVDGREIRALGTSFIVRHDESQAFSVTLIEGQISVNTNTTETASNQAPQLLAPGQRLTLSKNLLPVMDRPEIGRVTAWERGRLEFDDLPLREAADEMNRYNRTRILIEDDETANLRIGGVFRAGDSDEFVRVAAVALRLRVEHRRGEIVLLTADSKR